MARPPKPDLKHLRHYVKTRPPLFEDGRPNRIPPHRSIYKCECCNDTGIVQAWKLQKFFPEVFGDYVDPIVSFPVFCQRVGTCGEYEIPIYEDHKQQKFSDQDSKRTARVNLFTTPEGENTTLGEGIGNGTHKCLQIPESEYIHQEVLALRDSLHGPEGEAYINEIMKRSKEAMPDAQRAKGPRARLQHIGLWAVPFEMPPEPMYEPTVEPPQPTAAATPDNDDLFDF